MSKSLSRLAAITAAAALAVSMSACTAGRWVYDSPPAAGVQADEGGVKLRNLMILTDGSDAALLGAVASRDANVAVTGLSVAAEAEDGTFGAAAPIEFQTEVGKGQTVHLDGSETPVEADDLIVGRLAEVTVGLSEGDAVTLKVPVYSAEHADFAEAWETIQG